MDRHFFLSRIKTHALPWDKHFMAVKQCKRGKIAITVFWKSERKHMKMARMCSDQKEEISTDEIPKKSGM